VPAVLRSVDPGYVRCVMGDEDMSTENAKESPDGVPPEHGQLADRLERAIEEPEIRQDFHLRLDVEGGHAGERYEFRFRASGTGDAEVSLVDNLRGRRDEAKAAKLTQRDISGLLGSLDVSTLLGASRLRPRIPPGSVVGRLDVSDGRQNISILFMADPGQAESAGYRMPPGLAETLERLYELGAKHLGTKDVRP
jgi:hypothetical protein